MGTLQGFHTFMQVCGANLFVRPGFQKEIQVTHHPDLHLVDVRCSSCGTSFTTRSTAATISVEVCSACHPAYTGLDRAAVSGDRIERFNRRLARSAA